MALRDQSITLKIEDYPLFCIFVLLASQQSERVQLLKTVTDAIIKQTETLFLGYLPDTNIIIL